MKKVVVSVLLFIALNTSAQLGIITLGKNDLPYYGQWYVVNTKEFKNKSMYFDENEIVDSLLLDLLEPWDLTMKDGRKDEDGDLFWTVDNDNGFYSTVYLVRIDEDASQIIIVTSENE